MDNCKALARATLILPESDFWANTKFQLALIDFQLEKSRLVQGICNNGAAFAIAANNVQKAKLSDFSILNCRRANWDLVLIQKSNSELTMACQQKHKKKTNLYILKNFTFFKTAVFF